MEFSLFFFADSSATGPAGYRLLLDSARFADANGLAAVWTPERHFHPFGGRYPNPAVTGAAVAAITERVRIRAGSVVAPLHHPIRIAEEWSVVDNLSGGRVGVSFASGWHAGDFVLRPDNYADRRAEMFSAVDVVKRLWRGEEVKFAGPSGEQQEVRIYPQPVQPELPVWITSAGSTETFRAAGRLGANLLTHLLGQDRGTLARNIAAYSAAYRDARGPNAEGHVTLMLHTLLGKDREQVLQLAREPLTAYLRSSMDLVKASGLLPAGLDPEALPVADQEYLAAQAAERYLGSGGLFGTVADGRQTVAELDAIGVDEVACLIDFGVPVDEVLAALPHLAELDRSCQSGRHG